MSEGRKAEELAGQAAEAVRRVVAAAEERAAEIVREAEAEAARIRERAEADAQERIEGAQHALDGLRGKLEGGAAASQPAAESPPTEPHPAPVPEPAPEPAPDPVPPPAGNGDDAAARLLAMKLAIDGKGREEIAYELDAKFGAADRDSLLDDVLARAGK
jgi:hypothetical protein